MIIYDFCEKCGTDELPIEYYSITKQFLCKKCLEQSKKDNFSLEVKEWTKDFELYP